jgi:hypothetical protein
MQLAPNRALSGVRWATVVNNVVEGQAYPVVVDIEAASQLSVAMVENSVPLVARVSLTNTSDTALSNLTVELALLPDFSAKWTTHVSAIPPGGTFHLDTIELPLDRDRLVNQLERSRAELMLWVRSGAGNLPIATQSRPVDVLAYNEWSPLTVPHLLAAYILARADGPPSTCPPRSRSWSSTAARSARVTRWSLRSATTLG